MVKLKPEKEKKSCRGISLNLRKRKFELSPKGVAQGPRLRAQGKNIKKTYSLLMPCALHLMP
jgi:hypothetical protein